MNVAAEKRLINANIAENACSDAEKIIRSEATCDYDRGWADAIASVVDMIKRIPTVDAVEVVRCDECIHYKQPDEGDFLGLCTSGILSVSHNGEIYPGRGFFCLYGERRSDGL